MALDARPVVRWMPLSAKIARPGLGLQQHPVEGHVERGGARPQCLGHRRGILLHRPHLAALRDPPMRARRRRRGATGPSRRGRESPRQPASQAPRSAAIVVMRRSGGGLQKASAPECRAACWCTPMISWTVWVRARARWTATRWASGGRARPRSAANLDIVRQRSRCARRRVGPDAGRGSVRPAAHRGGGVADLAQLVDVVDGQPHAAARRRRRMWGRGRFDPFSERTQAGSRPGARLRLSGDRRRRSRRRSAASSRADGDHVLPLEGGEELERPLAPGRRPGRDVPGDVGRAASSRGGKSGVPNCSARLRAWHALDRQAPVPDADRLVGRLHRRERILGHVDAVPIRLGHQRARAVPRTVRDFAARELLPHEERFIAQGPRRPGGVDAGRFGGAAGVRHPGRARRPRR